LGVKEFIDMKKLSKEQIIEQLEDGIEQLKNILSEATIENEQERIIRKNRIIAKLERENEILRTKLEEARKG
jgi:predicted ATPase with chaperone activity